MLVTKIGDSLAVRLSAEDAARINLKEGDQVEIISAKTVEPDKTASSKQDAFERLSSFRGRMPADYKFDRDEANER
jgi:antitoxin MazE